MSLDRELPANAWRDPLHSCAGKERFSTPQLAAKIARARTKSKRFRKKLARPMSSYRCTDCGGFHIGGRGGHR